MYCPYCGTKLDDKQLFCHICGESQVFEEDDDTAAAPADEICEVNTADAPAEAIAEVPAEVPVEVPVETPVDTPVAEAAVPAAEPEVLPVPMEKSPAVKPIAEPTPAPAAKKATPARSNAAKAKAGKRIAPPPPPAKRVYKRPAKKKSTKPAVKVADTAVNGLQKGVDYIKTIGIKQLVLWCTGVVAAVLLLVVIISAVIKANEQHVLAVVSNDLCYYTNGEPTVLELNYDEDAVAYIHGSAPGGILAQVANAVVCGNDRFIYLDDYIEESNSWTLKINDLDKPETELRVDSGVYSELNSGTPGQAENFSSEWKISLDGSVIFYIKDMTERGGSLYRYCDGESQLVGSGCLAFNITDSGDRAAWIACDANGSATVLNTASFTRKGLAEQLDTQFYDIVGFDDKLDAIYYTRTNGEASNPYSVYVAGLGADKERLVAGVNYVSQVSDDGGFFYGTADSGKNEILYWHAPDGEEILVTRTCSGVVFADAKNSTAIYYSETLTERTYYMFSRGMSIDFGKLWAVDAECDAKGENIYIMLLEEGVGRGLYSCAISSKGIEKPVLISERCSELLMDEASNTLFYAIYSDINSEKTSLYMWDGEASHLLSDDAYPMVVYDGKDSWAFFTDAGSAIYAEEGPHLARGTLNVYKDGNVIEIDENVSMLFWHFRSDRSVIYIKDYLDAFGGTLYIAEPGETPQKLAIDAQAVIPEEECLKSFGR